MLNQGAKSRLVFAGCRFSHQVRVLAHGGELSENHEECYEDRAFSQRHPMRPGATERFAYQEAVAGESAK